MIRILFLSYGYPNGEFGPSTMCSVRIMEALAQSGDYEVHCLSYQSEGDPTYSIVPGVVMHPVIQMPKTGRKSKLWIHFHQLLMLPWYPYQHFISDYKHYRAVKRHLQENVYDIVVSQYYPEPSILVGSWLKQKGFIKRWGVLFWDNIYGLMPRSFIPIGYALAKQRKAESKIAKQADLLVSLYPIKAFHVEQGDIPEAAGKRAYLGIPSITRPKDLPESPYRSFIKDGKINMLYSGTIFKKEYVSYLIELLNQTEIAADINLLFFTRSLGEDDFQVLREEFKGTIQSVGWVKLAELLALYPHVDFFMSFPGAPTAIRSKVYEYMSYGKPILLLTEDSNDVNVSTFAKYPLCRAFDVRVSSSQNVSVVNGFLSSAFGATVSFEDVENLFMADTAAAYVKLISERLVNGQ